MVAQADNGIVNTNITKATAVARSNITTELGVQIKYVGGKIEHLGMDGNLSNRNGRYLYIYTQVKPKSWLLWIIVSVGIFPSNFKLWLFTTIC